MRHYTVLQYGDNGPFHFVTAGSKGGAPTEGCTVECDHKTAEEAWAHHREWVLDNLSESTMSNQQLRCQVKGCEAWTQKTMDEPGGYSMEPLCDEHRTREAYAEHFYPEGAQRESWRS